MTPIQKFVLNAERLRVLPVAVYPGLHLTGGTIGQVVSDSVVQVACIEALAQRYDNGCVLTAMDLSAEAEAFGAEVRLEAHEVPTVIGRLLTEPRQVAALHLPVPGAARTSVHLDAVRRLAAAPGDRLVLGGMIGPFSLAGRLWGVSEFLELAAMDPDTALALLEKVTAFLIAYAGAFKRAGADGLVMAEPAAGLLSPRMLASFSSAFVRTILRAVEDDRFGVILHNCAARPLHLEAVLESGASAYHFGAPMDMAVALARMAPTQIVLGNLDPSAVFVQLEPAAVRARVLELVHTLRPHRHAVLSSGCDLPPGASLANLDACFAAAGYPARETAPSR
ncbi:MAG: uroporphyrinogen decarboxylase family protein [Lentisphaerae bacterium]|nr:uroporphyrinogen decarboxylase family protein [Lentisphaerota bacterium]